MTADLFGPADWLKAGNNAGYGPLPIPLPRDTQISDLIRAWAKLDDASRNASLSQVKGEYRDTLMTYSDRMASLAVRDGDREHIFLGLLAQGLDGWRGDWRENLLSVCLHYDAAKRIGLSPDVVFEEAAKLLPSRPAEGLRAFLRRSPHDQSLKAFKYITGSDSGGFRYVRTW